jgi:hypothetical protein
MVEHAKTRREMIERASLLRPALRPGKYLGRNARIDHPCLAAPATLR